MNILTLGALLPILFAILAPVFFFQNRKGLRTGFFFGSVELRETRTFLFRPSVVDNLDIMNEPTLTIGPSPAPL